MDIMSKTDNYYYKTWLCWDERFRKYSEIPKKTQCNCGHKKSDHHNPSGCQHEVGGCCIKDYPVSCEMPGCECKGFRITFTKVGK